MAGLLSLGPSEERSWGPAGLNIRDVTTRRTREAGDVTKLQSSRGIITDSLHFEGTNMAFTFILWDKCGVVVEEGRVHVLVYTKVQQVFASITTRQLVRECP